ncbi:phosphonate C-P lyase system protein PhnH [Arcobacter sp. KX21116]|jgi:alpha-D-ribose 1-methylphosphonate 5-triphosphate synthase subunit PhnH|uniref:phosphonate C-P lyase system protein PhnH n=1 Tax=Arcobacter iocasae TaxID=2906515 RepID=UPI0035D45E20|tara:strand:+ start:152 stop:688 length:537 start_codon:yes stop_codon:yes gene_type:complete
MNTTDIEKNNRENFRYLLDTLSMPGTIKTINKLFDSYTLAVASVLLYSEVSYLNNTKEDFSVIDAITNSKEDTIENTDYLFCDNLDDALLLVKKGTFLNPDYSCTIICLCDSFNGETITLKGPGIDKQKDESYPVNKGFIEEFNNNNISYPLGNEIIFLNKNNGQIKSLCRTTKLEIA